MKDNKFENVLVYPNPAVENLNIEISVDKSETIKITVTNLFSQVFAAYETEISEGKNQIIFPLKNFANGTFFVNISSSHETFLQKIIVNK